MEIKEPNIIQEQINEIIAEAFEAYEKANENYYPYALPDHKDFDKPTEKDYQAYFSKDRKYLLERFKKSILGTLTNEMNAAYSTVVSKMSIHKPFSIASLIKSKFQMVFVAKCGMNLHFDSNREQVNNLESKKTDEYLKSDFEKYLSNIYENNTDISSFMRNDWFERVFTNFAGCYLIELEGIEDIEERKLESNTLVYDAMYSRPYIVFRQSNTIRYIEREGDKIEAILFEKYDSENPTKCRYITKDYDVLFYSDKKTDFEILPNHFGCVPVVMVLPSIDNTSEKYCINHPINENVLSILDNILYENATQMIQKPLNHAIVATTYAEACPDCEGNKTNDDGTTCNTCRGAGRILSSAPIKMRAAELGAFENTSPPKPSEYYALSDATSAQSWQEFYAKENDILKSDISTEIFADSTFLSSENLFKNATATEVISRYKNAFYVIMSFKKLLENTHKKIVDLIGRGRYGDAYVSCDVLYGSGDAISLVDNKTVLMEYVELLKIPNINSQIISDFERKAIEANNPFGFDKLAYSDALKDFMPKVFQKYSLEQINSFKSNGGIDDFTYWSGANHEDLFEEYYTLHKDQFSNGNDLKQAFKDYAREKYNAVVKERMANTQKNDLENNV